MNKPERVFGLLVRCMDLDIFKIVGIFLDFFGILGGIFGEFFWGIFLEDFFGRIFWEKYFGRNSLGGILCLHCKSQLSYLNLEGIDLDFCQDFVSMQGRKEGQEFRSLEV